VSEEGDALLVDLGMDSLHFMLLGLEMDQSPHIDRNKFSIRLQDENPRRLSDLARLIDECRPD
jgi:hypothetical protein